MTTQDRDRPPIDLGRASGDGSRARIEVVAVDDLEQLARARDFLGAEQQRLGGPAVDESEQQRLDAVAAGASWPAGWSPALVRLGGNVVGYGAVVAGEGDPHAAGTGDLAPSRAPGVVGPVLRVLVEWLSARLPDAQVWMRAVDVEAGELAPALEAGAAIDRQLGVLGRSLEARATASSADRGGAALRGKGDQVPAGVTIRASRPGVDDAGIVAVLAAAYDGTGDGGWTQERFQARTRLPWFDASDLLVAERGTPGRIIGLHWLKRRDATTGEVYNLAVHPDAQGIRLGPALLEAGLDHLVSRGLTDALLWVDRANTRAVALYEAAGFTTRWDDVALRLPGA